MPIVQSTGIQAGLPTMTFTLRARPARGHRLAARRSATRSSSASRSASSARSRPGTTRCTRSPRRSRPRSRSGCTVVLKPSEVAPLNAFILAEIIDEVGAAGRACSTSSPAPAPWSARRSPSHPDVDMVSFTGSTRAGPAGERAGGAEREAGRAGARRQVAERDPRRRRSRDGRHRRRREVLPELRPDVQRADAHAGAARPARGGGAHRRDGRGRLHGRRPVRGGHAARPARVRRAARARARLHPQGRRGGRAARHRRRGSARRAWTAATSCGRRSSPTCAPT